MPPAQSDLVAFTEELLKSKLAGIKMKMLAERQIQFYIGRVVLRVVFALLCRRRRLQHPRHQPSALLCSPMSSLGNSTRAGARQLLNFAFITSALIQTTDGTLGAAMTS